MTALKIKTQKVTNQNNVLVQIPKFIIELWGIQNGDKLEVCLNEDTKSLVVRKVEDNTEETLPTT